MNWDRKDFTERQEKLFDTSVFLGKLLLLAVPFQLFLVLEPDTVIYQEFHAGLISWLLNSIGYNTFSQGIDILLDDTIYRITQDCLGWKSMAAFSALTIATETKLKSLRFVVIGILVLFVVNIVRILTTILLSEVGIISYSVIHGTLWKWGLTFVILVLWIFWLERRNDNFSSPFY